ncbi:MAG: ChbG/HpnK family deacetylase [Rhodocyclales bacterium]|nr:ChbG/HpnK family deacetylase [Rhodocyclales bacterium]
MPEHDRIGVVPRPIIVCADDFGLAPGVSDAILTLIAAGRLSATSCMTPLADWRRSASMLREIVARFPADVGLHLTLTDHAPLTPAPRVASNGRLPALGRMLARTLAHALPRDEIRDEVRAQLDAFEDHWGRAPDFIDGHQHVHVLPIIRDAVVEEVLRRYPAGQPWIRDCVESPWRIVHRRSAMPKALLISALAWRMRRLLRAHGIAANDGFSGVYDFSARIPFANRMKTFLDATGPRPLVHVHPGRVDAELLGSDPLTVQREIEFAYLMSEQFPAVLAAAALRPARYADVARGW